MTLTQVISLCSVLLTVIGLAIAWYYRRKEELRRDEVQRWADSCIRILQTIALISELDDQEMDQETKNEKRKLAIFETSILIEQGRLFFKNEISDEFGSEKLPAYRGYRPRILDHLVVAHQLARRWPDNSDDDRARRTALAQTCVGSFVSLAQQEVGRQRSAATEPAKGGRGTDLDYLLTQQDITSKR